MADSQVRGEGGDGGGSSEVIATVLHIRIGGFEVRRWIVYNDAGSLGDNRSGFRIEIKQHEIRSNAKAITRNTCDLSLSTHHHYSLFIGICLSWYINPYM